VRELVLARRAGVVAVAATCGALIATPALADVAVSPAVAAQGTGQDFDFHVTNSGNQPLATIKLTLPEDAPIAEAYPLSNEDWAPKITTRELGTALPTLHTGIPTTEATDAITWIAMPGHALAPGKSADLRISVGPLPTLSTMKFTVTTTYAGGAAGPPMSPLNITLNPPTAAQIAAEHAGHDESATGGSDGTTADDPNAAEDAQFAKVVGDATRGTSIWVVLGWVVAAAALLAGIWLMFRSRHRAEEDEEPEDDEATATGDPKAKTGDPKAKTGDPKAKTGDPKAKTGDPKAKTGEPAGDEDAEDEDAKEPVTAGKWSLKE
jgi:hypothetical protein